MQSNSKSGSYSGNGTDAFVADLGFRPKYVVICNVTDGDKIAHIFDNGVDGKALLDNDSGSDVENMSIISEPLITSRGFTTGTNASLIENAKVFQWVAFR